MRGPVGANRHARTYSKTARRYLLHASVEIPSNKTTKQDRQSDITLPMMSLMDEPNDCADQQVREEIQKRLASSTCVVNSICLRGFANQAEADKVGAPVLGCLRLLGGYLNLERLHAVTVAFDYAAALAAIETGTDRKDQS